MGNDQTITRGKRALQLFCDRIEERARFVRCLNEDPPKRRILFFHGDGGHGKSLLLQHLANRLCHYALYDKSWQASPAALLIRFEALVDRGNECAQVPCVTLDFSVQTQEGHNPLEPIAALSYLRRMLVKEGFRFPLFDYGVTLQLYRTQRLHSKAIQDLLGSHSLGIVSDLATLLDSTPYVSIATKLATLLTGGIENDAAVWARARKLDPKEIEWLTQMDPLRELPGELPRLFAEDLNAAMSNKTPPHPRLALLFDSQEAFAARAALSGLPRGVTGGDGWLRTLLVSLRHDVGIVAVVAGRDQPSWAGASRNPIPASDVEVSVIGHLCADDAHEYLIRAGIDLPELRSSILSGCCVEPDQHHPLYLGLCADIVLAGHADGVKATADLLTAESFVAELADRDSRGRLLLERLLQYCSDEMVDGVHCMAAARAFDFGVFHQLGSDLHFSATYAQFQHLVNLSFIRPVGEDRYKVHALMRRILRARSNERTHDADRALERWYRFKHDQGDALAIAESLYHAAQTDTVHAAREWLLVFATAAAASQHALCVALIDLLDELKTAAHDLRCQAWNRVGDYFVRVADDRGIEAYRRAEQLARRRLGSEPNDPTALAELGRALQGRGDWHAMRGEKDAEPLFEQAIAAQQAAVQQAPLTASLQRHLGGSHHRMAEWCLARDDPSARMHFASAVAAYRLMLSAACQDPETPQAIGLAHLALADCQVALGEAEARASYEAAIRAFEQLLESDPNSVRTLNCLGNAWHGLGEHQAGHMEQGAEDSLRRAAAAYSRVISQATGAVESYHNLGVVCRRLADWAYRQGRGVSHEDFDASAQALKQALALAPKAVSSWASLGSTYRSLGDRLSAEGEARATHAYEQAEDAYLRALRIAPMDANVHNSLGLVQRSLAESKQATPGRSRKQLELALASFAQAIRLSPQRAQAHRNLAIAHRMMADSMTSTNDDQAIAHYEAALAGYEQAVKRIGPSVDLLNGIGLAHIGLAHWLSRNDPAAALLVYERAIGVLDQASGKEPAAVNLHNNAADAWVARSALLDAESSLDVALADLELAITRYGRALSNAPGDAYAAERLAAARATEIVLRRRLSLPGAA